MTLSTTIDAPIATVYGAFINTTQICEWLCEDAQIEAQKDGRLYLYWRTPKYYVMGEFLEVETNKHLKLRWQDMDNPKPQEVKIHFSEEKNATKIEMTFEHNPSSQCEKLLNRGFAVLESTQTTGYHLDILERPMLGVIVAGVVNAENAARYGVPIDYGIALSDTIAGLSAQAAGLQNGDVIESMNNTKLTNFGTMTAILSQHKAGDSINLRYYQAETVHDVTLVLQARQLQPYPNSISKLAEQLSKDHQTIEQELEAVMVGVSPEHAAKRPSEKAWSANHVLAHLIQTERENQAFIAGLVVGTELETFSSNLDARVDATLEQHQNATALLKAFKAVNLETKAMIAALPNDFLQRKASVVRLQLNGELYSAHPRQHIEQIKRALAAARAA
jgi:uncharacterized protein YndB with AHSA1/START domain